MTVKRRRCRTRRSFLADTGMGFTGLALGAMLARAGRRPGRCDRRRHAAPPPAKAKAVIWIFLCGGVSHVESFDPKPELNRFAGKSIEATPYKDVLNPSKLKDLVSANPQHGGRKILMGLNTGVPQVWPERPGGRRLVAARRRLRRRHRRGALALDHRQRPRRAAPVPHGPSRPRGAHPTIGSWITYGLGTLNEDLPEYVVLGEPTGDCCGGSWTHGAAYLGPEYAGVRLNPDAKEPLPFVSPAAGMSAEDQIAEFGLLGRLNRLAGIDYPDDPSLRARIKAYELAYGMQTAVPETLKLAEEDPSTQTLYGLDRDATRPSAGSAWPPAGWSSAASGSSSSSTAAAGAGPGTRTPGIRANHAQLSEQVDLPIAGLLRDLKRRGMLDETIVVWGTEFGRSPGAQADGRDHHPQGFCAWLAGGGIKGGVVHGATDELGFHAVEDRHYVTDIHATVLHQLGLDPRKLEVPGRKRLEIDYGQPIRAILA